MKFSSLINTTNFKPLVLTAATLIRGNPSRKRPDQAAKGQEESSFKNVLNLNRKIK